MGWRQGDLSVLLRAHPPLMLEKLGGRLTGATWRLLRANVSPTAREPRKVSARFPWHRVQILTTPAAVVLWLLCVHPPGALRRLISETQAHSFLLCSLFCGSQCLREELPMGQSYQASLSTPRLQRIREPLVKRRPEKRPPFIGCPHCLEHLFCFFPLLPSAWLLDS